MISANTLFHFTNNLDNIKNILTNNFSPRYCLERVGFLSQNDNEKKLDIAIPMICFCDIPLSQITNHIRTYGNYAIGLKKDWAIKNGISPVLYLYNKSRTNQLSANLFHNCAFIDQIKEKFKINNSRKSTIDYMEFQYYCKDYKGDMWRDNKLKKHITFYNEREWRYIPNIKDLNKLVLSKTEYDNIEERNKYNKKVDKFKLNFTPEDIKYIIINKESERLNVIDMILYIKSIYYESNDLKVLNSKIISIEQIREDF